MAALAPRIRLNSVDLPTLGRPTMAMSGGVMGRWFLVVRGGADRVANRNTGNRARQGRRPALAVARAGPRGTADPPLPWPAPYGRVRTIAEVRRLSMPTSTLTSKGQTTIPREIRGHLHLRPGARLEFVLEEDGRVVLLPATVDAGELAGMLKAPSRPVSVEEMNRAVRRRGGRR